MKLKIRLSLCSIALMLPFSAICQSGVNTAGGQANSPNGSVSYSIGQWAYKAPSSSAGTVEQGVQHAYEIIPVGINKLESNMELNVFPNPTNQDITLVVKNANTEKLFYQLFDAEGKLISTQKIVSENTPVIMYGLSSASYYLNIYKPDNQKIKSFNIIKNK